MTVDVGFFSHISPTDDKFNHCTRIMWTIAPWSWTIVPCTNIMNLYTYLLNHQWTGINTILFTTTAHQVMIIIILFVLSAALASWSPLLPLIPEDQHSEFMDEFYGYLKEFGINDCTWNNELLILHAAKIADVWSSVTFHICEKNL